MNLKKRNRLQRIIYTIQNFHKLKALTLQDKIKILFFTLTK